MSLRTMTDGEVVTSFRQAKDKREQIKILAELNCCRKDEILSILTSAGEDVSEYIAGVRKRHSPSRHKKWTEDDVTILEEGCKNGGSCEEIAEALGRTVDSTYAKASEMGFVSAAGGEKAADPAAKTEPRKEQHRWTEADDEALIELRAEGMSRREIADAIGCARQSVDFHIAKLKEEGRLPGGSVKKPKVKKTCINEDFDRCFKEAAATGEAASPPREEAHPSEADGGGTCRLYDLMEMMGRLSDMMRGEPRSVRIDIPGGDLAELTMDFSGCRIIVQM